MKNIGNLSVVVNGNPLRAGICPPENDPPLIVYANTFWSPYQLESSFFHQVARFFMPGN